MSARCDRHEVELSASTSTRGRAVSRLGSVRRPRAKRCRGQPLNPTPMSSSVRFNRYRCGITAKSEWQLRAFTFHSRHHIDVIYMCRPSPIYVAEWHFQQRGNLRTRRKYFRTIRELAMQVKRSWCRHSWLERDIIIYIYSIFYVYDYVSVWPSYLGQQRLSC